MNAQPLRSIPKLMAAAALAIVPALAAAGENTNADLLPCARGSHADKCLLEHDVVLTTPLRLASNTTLNCRGFALLPQAPGVADVEATTTNEYRPSRPEVAILIERSHGANVKNCAIGTDDRPFDFGVFVLDTKVPPADRADPHLWNRIVDNRISGKYAGVTLVKADATHIGGNAISFGIGARGRGISVFRDSDGNKISQNLLVAHSFGPATIALGRTAFREVPQQSTRPLGQEGNGARGITSNVLKDGVLNFVYDGELTQVPVTRDLLVPAGTWLGQCVDTTCSGNACRRCSGDAAQTCVDDLDCGLGPNNLTEALSSDDNVYDGNTVDFGVNANVGHLGSMGIATFGAVGDKITNNTVLAVEEAIHFSAISNMTLAGRCSLDGTEPVVPTRFCVSNGDCNIPGFDNMTQGTCVGARSLPGSTVNIGAKNALVEGNTVVGPTRCGIAVSRATIGVKVIGNDVSGAAATWDSSGPVAGIAISNNALESVEVIRNKVHDNAVNFRVTVPGTRPIEQPRWYGAVVTLNDFTRSLDSQGALTCSLAGRAPTPASCIDSCPADQGACIRGFDLPAELSSDGRGNYWGRSCNDSDGFRDANEPDATGSTDSPTLLTTDSHPYGVPVADTSEPLPVTCR